MRKSVYMKPLNIVGLIVFAGGALALIGYGFYEMMVGLFLTEDVPLIIKWGIIALIVGLIIMLISLILERIRDKKEEDL